MMGQPWTEAWQLELGPEDWKVSEHADVKGNNLHFVTELYISLSLYIYTCMQPHAQITLCVGLHGVKALARLARLARQHVSAVQPHARSNPY